MLKLMICAIKMRPVDAEGARDLLRPAPPLLAAASKTRSIHSSQLVDGADAEPLRLCARVVYPTSPGTERRTRSLRRRQWPESLGPESSWPRRDCVPPLPSLHADQTHANSCAKRRQTDVHVPVISAISGSVSYCLSFRFSPPASAIDHGQAGEIHRFNRALPPCPSSSCWQISNVKTAVNNMNTSA